MPAPSDRAREIGKHYEKVRAGLEPTKDNNTTMVAQLMKLDEEETLPLLFALLDSSAEKLGATNEQQINLVVGIFLIGLTTGLAVRDADSCLERGMPYSEDLRCWTQEERIRYGKLIPGDPGYDDKVGNV